MSTPIPCRVCGCQDGEPGLCHAIHYGRRGIGLVACRRWEPDLCSSCSFYSPRRRELYPEVPLDAHLAETRANTIEQAAAFRGSSVPGAWQLRRHAAELRIKARQICTAAGLTLPLPVRESPPAEMAAATSELS